MIAAEILSDHRLAYLDYEGPVSGNRGTVVAFDRGEYRLVAETDDSLTVELRGGTLNGTARITRASHAESLEFRFQPESAQPRE
jgi:hypothetical protein